MGKLLCIFLSILGFFLSLLWQNLTYSGWDFLKSLVKYANSFQWDGYQNPFEVYETWKKTYLHNKPNEDVIERNAKNVISLFMLGYFITIISLIFIVTVFP